MKLEYPEKFNIKLAQQVLTQVTLHPETHDQSNVMNECGTVGCIAGWACVICGVSAFMEKAEELLGLTEEESDDLFSGGISEDQACELLADMIRQAILFRAEDRAEEERQRQIDDVARLQVAHVSECSSTDSHTTIGWRLFSPRRRTQPKSVHSS